MKGYSAVVKSIRIEKLMSLPNYAHKQKMVYLERSRIIRLGADRDDGGAF